MDLDIYIAKLNRLLPMLEEMYVDWQERKAIKEAEEAEEAEARAGETAEQTAARAGPPTPRDGGPALQRPH